MREGNVIRGVEETAFLLVPKPGYQSFALVIDLDKEIGVPKELKHWKFPGGGVNDPRIINLLARMYDKDPSRACIRRQIQKDIKSDRALRQVIGAVEEVYQETGLEFDDSDMDRFNVVGSLGFKKVLEIHHAKGGDVVLGHILTFFIAPPPKDPDRLCADNGKVKNREIEDCQWFSKENIVRLIENNRIFHQHARAFQIFLRAPEKMPVYDCPMRKENCPVCLERKEKER